MIWDIDSYVLVEVGPLANPRHEWFMRSLVKSDAELKLLEARYTKRLAQRRAADQRRKSNRTQG